VKDNERGMDDYDTISMGNFRGSLNLEEPE